MAYNWPRLAHNGRPMFRLQKVSNYGTGTPAVARTALQGEEILTFFARPQEETDSALKILLDLKRHLLRCVEIRDELAKEIATGRDQVAREGFSVQSGGRVVTLPGIGDLQSKAEGFLQSAKLAIAETGNLTNPFYQASHGHQYHKFSAWADKIFGPTDDLTLVVKSWEPFVKRIVEMRNAVDHPLTAPGAPLKTVNFLDVRSSSGVPELLDPSWGLTGEDVRPILPDFDLIIEKVICLGENVLVRLFYKLRNSEIVEIYEIPPDKRDPSNPRRLIVGLAGNE